MTDTDDPKEETVRSLDEQLVSLYADRELLERALGTSDPQMIIDMVRSLEEQLVELYADRDRGQAEKGAGA